jgi:hypothetical protein
VVQDDSILCGHGRVLVLEIGLEQAVRPAFQIAVRAAAILNLPLARLLKTVRQQGKHRREQEKRV